MIGAVNFQVCKLYYKSRWRRWLHRIFPRVLGFRARIVNLRFQDVGVFPEYNFRIEYDPATENVIATALDPTAKDPPIGFEMISRRTHVNLRRIPDET